MSDTSFAYSNNILNVVVVGQSGVGKSSFLNYIADKEFFKTGVGGAVTKGYFEKYVTKRNNTSYALYDTEGLEPGKVDKWESNILSEIRKRDKLNDMAEWFHSILFCISAESKRVQPFEIDAIRRLASSGHVIVLLTKMDRVSTENINEMKKEIFQQLGDQIDVLPVCSVSQKYRNGTQSKRQGLEEVMATTFIGLWKKMAALIPSIILRDVMFCSKTFYYQENLPCYISWNLLNGVARSDNSSLGSMNNICTLIGLSAFNVSLQTKVTQDWFKKTNKLGLYIASDYTGIRAMGTVDFRFLLALPVTPSKDIIDWGIFRKALNEYLIDWKHIYDSLYYALRNFDEKSIVDSLKNSIEVCKHVYQNVTGKELGKKVSLYDIQKNLSELKTLTKIPNLDNKLSAVKQSIKEVDNCTFFSSSERDDLVHKYGIFKAALDDFRNQYNQVVTALVKSIQQELRSFADYTLRSENSQDNAFIFDKEEFSSFLKIFKSELSRFEWDKCMAKMYNSNLFDKMTRDFISGVN